MKGLGRIEVLSFHQGEIQGLTVQAVVGGVTMTIDIDTGPDSDLRTAFQYNRNVDVELSQ